LIACVTRFVPACHSTLSSEEPHTSDSSNFNRPYADAYDALYRDKDYAAECDFLEAVFRRYSAEPVQSIIDLGCGTGGHAIPLARRNYHVCGVDRSAEMIAIARTKASSADPPVDLWLEVADICNLDLQNTFDAAICMFAVLGYQTTNQALYGALQTVRRHLKPGGLFVCDFWYGPAVLKQQARDRVKIVADGGDRVIRTSVVSTQPEKDVVVVSTHILRLRGDRVIAEAEEMHPMRYFFQPEIDFFMWQAGLEIVAFCPCGGLDAAPTDSTWNVSVVARAMEEPR
jgi:SAM-dependent methyltransferase